ncbi:NADH-dependent flavin oxidoreductase nadA [Ditylenchus destructor]|uniref:NADH-dependent flavin oxidoreductase nadA n=1 Tax=Ditylenchus destructor TaxID=166010 RepID=A0AAD4QV47_9BILA|nr:NADH-dependent flavin oxidoreductase nadA [Ditylenchus destructor]
MPARYNSKGNITPKWLAKKLKLPHSGRVLKNRFYKVPMSEYISVADKNNLHVTGVPTKAFSNMYEKWAAGGYGLISTGAILLDTNGLDMLPGNLFINPAADSEARRSGFRAMAGAVKQYGALLLGQLQTYTEQIAFYAAKEQEETSLEKTKYALKYLYDCGFDGATFVISLLPVKNGEVERDTDKVYRMIDAWVAAKRSVIPESSKFILGIKLCNSKLQPYGVTFEDLVKIAKKIESSPFDFIELAGGNYEHPYENDPDREGLFRKMVDEMKHHVKRTPLFATGGFRTVSTMEKVLREGKLDGIGLARPAAAEFDFPQKVLRQQVQSAIWNPFEQDTQISVWAGAAQMNQAGLRSLKECGGDLNFGVMDLSDQKTLEKFMAAKNHFTQKSEELQKQQQWPSGVVVIR